MPASMVVDTVRSLRTMAELVEHLGGIPAARIRLWPTPGTATAQEFTGGEVLPGCTLSVTTLFDRAGRRA